MFSRHVLVWFSRYVSKLENMNLLLPQQWSLFSSDGPLLIPTDKDAFVNAIEGYNQEPSSESGGDLVTPGASNRVEGWYNVYITDAMAIVQGSIDGKLL